jgi:hypothetical protein
MTLADLTPYRYVAFERGRGVPAMPRETMDRLLAQWNAGLEERHAVFRFVDSYGSSGNYVVESRENLPVSEVSRTFRTTLGALPGALRAGSLAVFRADDFVDWLTALRAAPAGPPSVALGRRPTRGVVMNTDPEGGTPPQPPSRETLAFGEFARARVREAWKLDRLAADGQRLDTKAREGGWGSLAEAMNEVQTGVWTARSLKALNGLAGKVKSSGDPNAPTPGSQAGPGSEPGPTGSDQWALVKALVTGTPFEESGRPFLAATTALDAAIHARRVAESMIRMLAARHNLPRGGRTLFELLGDLAARGFISERVGTYLHAIRRLGNTALHARESSSFGHEDREVIGWMLVLMLREVTGHAGPSRR